MKQNKTPEKGCSSKKKKKKNQQLLQKTSEYDKQWTLLNSLIDVFPKLETFKKSLFQLLKIACWWLLETSPKGIQYTDHNTQQPLVISWELIAPPITGSK